MPEPALLNHTPESGQPEYVGLPVQPDLPPKFGPLPQAQLNHNGLQDLEKGVHVQAGCQAHLGHIRPSVMVPDGIVADR